MYYLAIQNDFRLCTIALFRGSEKLESEQISNHEASAQLILVIERLLSKAKIFFVDLEFLAVNTGPAPYTALRTTIALVNGMAYATGIPLLSIDGLETLVEEYGNADSPVLAILNAFNREVYYAFRFQNELLKGCEKIEQLMERLKNSRSASPIHCIGNGVDLYLDLFMSDLTLDLYFPNPAITTCSIDAVARKGCELWSKQSCVKQLSIGYLKTYTVAGY